MITGNLTIVEQCPSCQAFFTRYCANCTMPITRKIRKSSAKPLDYYEEMQHSLNRREAQRRRRAEEREFKQLQATWKKQS